MPAVDRTVLRLGVFEMLYVDEVPQAVAISEAVALAKDLSTDESPAFINGVLSAIASRPPEPSDEVDGGPRPLALPHDPDRLVRWSDSGGVVMARTTAHSVLGAGLLASVLLGGWLAAWPAQAHSAEGGSHGGGGMVSCGGMPSSVLERGRAYQGGELLIDQNAVDAHSWPASRDRLELAAFPGALALLFGGSLLRHGVARPSSGGSYTRPAPFSR